MLFGHVWAGRSATECVFCLSPDKDKSVDFDVYSVDSRGFFCLSHRHDQPGEEILHDKTDAVTQDAGADGDQKKLQAGNE